MGSESMDRSVEITSAGYFVLVPNGSSEAILSEIDLTVTRRFGRQRTLWRSSSEAKRLY